MRRLAAATLAFTLLALPALGDEDMNDDSGHIVTQLLQRAFSASKDIAGKTDSCSGVSSALVVLPNFDQLIANLEAGREFVEFKEKEGEVKDHAKALVDLQNLVETDPKRKGYPKKKLAQQLMTVAQKQLVEIKARLAAAKGGTTAGEKAFLAGIQALEAFWARLQAGLRQSPACVTSNPAIGRGIGAALIAMGDYLLEYPSAPRAEKLGTASLDQGIDLVESSGGDIQRSLDLLDHPTPVLELESLMGIVSEQVAPQAPTPAGGASEDTSAPAPAPAENPQPQPKAPSAPAAGGGGARGAGGAR